MALRTGIVATLTIAAVLALCCSGRASREKIEDSLVAADSDAVARADATAKVEVVANVEVEEGADSVVDDVLFDGLLDSGGEGLSDTVELLDDYCEGQVDNAGKMWGFAPLAGTASSAVLLPDGNIAFVGGANSIYILTQDGVLVSETIAVSYPIPELAVSEALGVFYYAVVGGEVVAVDLAGNQLWSVEAAGPAGTGLVHWETSVIGGTVDGQIYALDEETGAIQWQVDLPAAPNSNPGVGPDGAVYIGCIDHSMYSVVEGSILWSVSAGGEIWSTPAVGPDQSVYFGSNDGRLYGVKSNGSVKWVTEVGGQIWGEPLVAADGDVYVASTSKYVTKLDSATGYIVWSEKVGSLSTSSPAEGPMGNVYLGTTVGKLLCVDSEEGDVIWSFQASASSSFKPLIVGSRLFIGTGKEFLGFCLAGL